MKHDDGILKIYEVTNTAANGYMPSYTKTLVSSHFFEFRTVGYGRYFDAAGVNERVDLVCRIWEDRNIHNDYVVLLNGEYYRIVQIQHLFDDDNLRVTDLSLERISDIEEVEEEEDEEVTPDVDPEQP